jgi:hypothetical protein
VRSAWGFLLLTACFDPLVAPGGACTTVCPGDLQCVNGTCQREPVQPDAAPPPDAAACVVTCAGDDLVCGDSSQTCALGCLEADDARCGTLAPSNGVDWSLAGAAALAVTGTVRIDSGTGEIRDDTNSSVVRPPGVGTINGISYTVVGGIAVIGVRELTVGSGATLRLEGTSRLALLVDGDAVIEGLVDASGGCPSMPSCPGPGGGRGGRNGVAAAGQGAGASGMAGGNGHGTGGGGAGLGQAGATSAGGSAAGATYGNASLVPLVAGSGGGFGGTANGGDGGGGGGGLQLTASGAITVAATGAIDAAGGGGGGELSFDTGGGGGGGSGGAILLEAVSITVLGTVTANGGGGGGHTMTPLSAGRAEDGRRDATAAAGAPGSWGGGNGGTGAIAPTVGRVSGDHGGGGGGGAGRIRINAVARDTPGVISPAASTGTVGVQ